MPKCIRCGEDGARGKICSSCLSKWCDMRVIAYNALESKLGKLSPENQREFKSKMRFLDRTWKSDKDKFNEEINKLINQ